MFGSRLSNRGLAEWCRSISSAVAAGIDVKKALDRGSRRGRAESRALNRRLLARIRGGEDFAGAVEAEGDRVPPLVSTMAHVAGKTGHLPEVLAQLADYFDFQVRLRRRFLAQIAWPVFQLLAAIFVVALVIYILGAIADSRGGQAVDLLGLGLLGGSGAAIWLAGCFGSLAGLAALHWTAKQVLGHGKFLDEQLLKIPVLGTALRTLALSRLCFALNLTLDSSMSVLEAVPLSLQATDNAAFASLGPRITDELRAGNRMSDAFGGHAIFPEEFHDVLGSGEESGSIPEAMGRLGRQYNDQAEHQLAALNVAAGGLVWSAVAILIVYIVFQMWSSYIGMIEEYSTF